MCQVLEKKLLGQNRDEAARAGGIAANVRSAIAHTRSLARGLSPVEMDARGLMSALEDLAGSVAAMSHIECVFRCDRPVRVNNHVTATHLFRIAQEALSNAVKHGRARRVRLELVPGREQLELVVRDDGRGFKADATRRKGMGLRLMKYRLGMMGGTLSIQSSAREGTTITAAVPRKALGATTPS
jgi:signal transduction histidine kinase